MMFLQINPPAPDSNIAWNVVLTIGVLVAIGANIIALARANRSQKREVQFTFTPASKEEFDNFSASTNANFVQVRAEMRQDRDDNQKHASARSQTIFNQIEKVRTELDTKIEDTRRELSEKIEDVPDRVIATLKNTGAI